MTGENIARAMTTARYGQGRRSHERLAVNKYRKMPPTSSTPWYLESSARPAAMPAPSHQYGESSARMTQYTVASHAHMSGPSGRTQLPVLALNTAETLSAI